MAADPEKTSPNGLKRLEERLKSEPAKNFSAYLRANFERLSKIIEGSQRGPSKWEILAAWAKEEELTGKKTLSAVAAKRAYEREAKRRREIEAPTETRRIKRSPPLKAEIVSVNPKVEDTPNFPTAASEEGAEDVLETLRREMNKRSGRSD